MWSSVSIGRVNLVQLIPFDQFGFAKVLAMEREQYGYHLLVKRVWLEHKQPSTPMSWLVPDHRRRFATCSFNPNPTPVPQTIPRPLMLVNGFDQATRKVPGLGTHIASPNAEYQSSLLSARSHEDQCDTSHGNQMLSCPESRLYQNLHQLPGTVPLLPDVVFSSLRDNVR